MWEVVVRREVRPLIDALAEIGPKIPDATGVAVLYKAREAVVAERSYRAAAGKAPSQPDNLEGIGDSVALPIRTAVLSGPKLLAQASRPLDRAAMPLDGITQIDAPGGHELRRRGPSWTLADKLP